MRPIVIAMAGLLGMAAMAAALQQDPVAKAQPGKEHEVLKQFEGEWEVQSKMMPPGKTPMESQGTETDRIGLGGFWVLIDYKGSDDQQQPWEGHGLMGYDPQKKKYVGVWAVSLCPNLATFEGEGSADGKTITATCLSTDPKTGKPMTERLVFQFTDKDHRTLRVFGTDESGKEALTGEMIYTRKVAEVK